MREREGEREGERERDQGKEGTGREGRGGSKTEERIQSGE